MIYEFSIGIKCLGHSQTMFFKLDIDRNKAKQIGMNIYRMNGNVDEVSIHSEEDRYGLNINASNAKKDENRGPMQQ